MPSEYGPIFCRKHLREKNLSEGLIFYRTESAHTDRFFIADKLSEGKVRFSSEEKSAHTTRFSLTFCLRLHMGSKFM